MSEDKEIKVNKDSSKAGLLFNVNVVKRGILSFYENLDHDDIRISKVHMGMSAVMECICHTLVDISLRTIKKDKTGLKTITRPVLRSALLENRELEKYYYVHLTEFSTEQDYSNQLPVSKKDLCNYLESKFNNYTLTPHARNLLNYLLYRVYLDMLRVSQNILDFYKRKTIKIDILIPTLRILFKDTALYGKLVTEVRRVKSLLTDENDDDNEDNEDNEDNKDNEDNDNKDDTKDNKKNVKKVNNAKPDNKKDKNAKDNKKEHKNKKVEKANKAEVIEKQSDDDLDDNTDEDEDEEEHEEEEKEEKENKKGKKGLKNGKKHNKAKTN